MPVLVAWLLEGLGALLVSAFAKIAFSIGMGFVTYHGVDLVLDQIRGFIAGSYAGLPTAVAQMAGLLQVDRAVSIIMSAIAARFVLAGVSGGSSFKRMVWK